MTKISKTKNKKTRKYVLHKETSLIPDISINPANPANSSNQVNSVNQDKTHKYIFSTKYKIKNKAINTKPILTSLSTVRKLPDYLKNNKKVVLKALDADISYFHSISTSLKDDIDVGKKIMEKHPEYFKLLSENLRDNKELGIKAVKYNPNLYNLLSERLKIDDHILKITDMVKVPLPNYNFKKKIDKVKYLKILKILSRYKTFAPNLLV